MSNATADMSDGIGIFSKVTYVCEDGYEAVGGRGKISCQENGTWSSTTSQCTERGISLFLSVFYHLYWSSNIEKEPKDSRREKSEKSLYIKLGRKSGININQRIGRNQVSGVMRV